ncbi:MAG TPA: hypothetical protein VKM72_31005 [Thermoanaerobaculia bacterium]|nr:hypothetical protein [Thermoanaerobaculia bacterium]
MSSNVDVMPETSAPLSETLKANDSSVVAPGTNVYLSFQGDPSQAFATAYSGVTYWFPTAGRTRIKAQLGFKGSELQEADTVKIISTETKLGNNNVLGAFADKHECYYYQDTQGNKQSWQVNATSPRPDGKIQYGDGVLLTNEYYNNQQLVPENGWLTTKPDLSAYWIIEKA